MNNSHGAMIGSGTDPNRVRAERGRAALLAFTDRNDVLTDLLDHLADLRHLSDLAGLPWSDLLEAAEDAYVEDGEHGPFCQHDLARYPNTEAWT